MSNRISRHFVSRAISLFAVFALALSFFACAAPAAPSALQTVTAPPHEQASPSPAATASPTQTPAPTPESTPDPALEPVTFAWISDTQGYASSFPDSLPIMTKWIVANRERLNIQYVIHTGDIVNDMLRKREWKAVEVAFDEFIGKIPFFAIAGNHDNKGMMHMYDDFHALMSRQNYTEYPTFGGEEALGRRRYDLVTIGYEDFILIGTGYSLQKSDYDWLNRVLAEHSDRTAILVAHWYLELKATDALYGDAKTLRRVVAANPNVRYVLCGHRHGFRRAEELYDDDGDGTPDRVVQAIMVDYQGLPNGGEGYFMLLTFNVVERTVSITSYSPVHDDYNYYEDESLETFTMPLSTVNQK